jgi:hypothetical protein
MYQGAELTERELVKMAELMEEENFRQKSRVESRA